MYRIQYTVPYKKIALYTAPFNLPVLLLLGGRSMLCVCALVLGTGYPVRTCSVGTALTVYLCCMYYVIPGTNEVRTIRYYSIQHETRLNDLALLALLALTSLQKFAIQKNLKTKNSNTL